MKVKVDYLYDLLVSKLDGQEEFTLEELEVAFKSFRLKHKDFYRITNLLCDLGYIERINQRKVRRNNHKTKSRKGILSYD